GPSRSTRPLARDPTDAGRPASGYPAGGPRMDATDTPTQPPDPLGAADVLAELAEFAPLSPPGDRPAGATPQTTALDFFLDVPVTVTARLGETVLPIGDLLKLGPGAVVELDRDVTQPV